MGLRPKPRVGRLQPPRTAPLSPHPDSTDATDPNRPYSAALNRGTFPRHHQLEDEERAKKAIGKLGKKRVEKDAASRPADLPPLTPEIATQNGVAAYPITEIITALKMTRGLCRPGQK